MGLFRRSKGSADPAAAAGTQSSESSSGSEKSSGSGRLPEGDDSMIDDSGMGPLRPRDRGLGDHDRARIAAGLAALAEQGVSPDDLAALGAAYDRAFTAWADTAKRKREDHDLIVERFAIGLGEYLVRHTDLQWRVVTDVFGTDLAVADVSRDGDFVVVPGNLVAARWMRGEIGWLPGVITHLVRLRTE